MDPFATGTSAGHALVPRERRREAKNANVESGRSNREDENEENGEKEREENAKRYARAHGSDVEGRKQRKRERKRKREQGETEKWSGRTVPRRGPGW